MDSDHEGAASPPTPEVLGRLVASHREFLRFLRARVPSPVHADEILQAAFVRTLEKGGGIRQDESAVAWFYRLLRNALTDHYRRTATDARRHDPEAAEALASEPELRDAVCACIRTLVPNLKAEYAEMIDRVDLGEAPIVQVAEDLGITPNNATVRLHRARKALKRELERSCGTCATHGCLDCSCAAAAPAR